MTDRMLGKLLRSTVVSKITGIPLTTLAGWRARARETKQPFGPPFLVFGPRTVYYEREALLRFIAENTYGVSEEQKEMTKQMKREAVAIGMRVLADKKEAEAAEARFASAANASLKEEE